jgi:lipoprotein-anchoring transpeptidase ErfK/SrfK
MLRSRYLAALLFAASPAIPVVAQPAGSGNKVAAAADTSSGTTTEAGATAETPRSGAEHTTKPKVNLRPTLTANIDLRSQRMIVKVDGQTQYSWPISSGVAAFPTPTGTFRPQRMEKMWYSRKYDMSPMPNAVFIHGGVAVHGTYHTAALGRAASHGCIRLSTAHAATFYNLVKRHGMARTRVTVYGRPDWRYDPEIANRDDSRRDRYADNQASWFWADGDNDDSAYDDGYARRQYRRDHRRRTDYDYRRPRRGIFGYADD